MTIKKFNTFILEFGTGYEGGPPGRDHVKIGDRMFTEIDLEDGEEDEEEDKDIPVLQDLILKENAEIDPYGEENWNETMPEFDYASWKAKGGSLYDFLRQLKNEFVDECLRDIEGADRKRGESLLQDIKWAIENDEDGPNLSPGSLKAVDNDIYDLMELCEPEEDEGPDPDLAYDQWRDRNLD
jgi:hypothetical protein